MVDIEQTLYLWTGDTVDYARDFRLDSGVKAVVDLKELLFKAFHDKSSSGTNLQTANLGFNSVARLSQPALNFVVPEGKRWIVNSVACWLEIAGNGLADWRVSVKDRATTIANVLLPMGGPTVAQAVVGYSRLWTGETWLEAGDELGIEIFVKDTANEQTWMSVHGVELPIV